MNTLPGWGIALGEGRRGRCWTPWRPLAGVALENLRLRGELRRLSVLEERARVARELEMREESTGGRYWLPRPCMQCDNPP